MILSAYFCSTGAESIWCFGSAGIIEERCILSNVNRRQRLFHTKLRREEVQMLRVRHRVIGFHSMNQRITTRLKKQWHVDNLMTTHTCSHPKRQRQTCKTKKRLTQLRWPPPWRSGWRGSSPVKCPADCHFHAQTYVHFRLCPIQEIHWLKFQRLPRPRRWVSSSCRQTQLMVFKKYI